LASSPILIYIGFFHFRPDYFSFDLYFAICVINRALEINGKIILNPDVTSGSREKIRYCIADGLTLCFSPVKIITGSKFLAMTREAPFW
jgi:hypothetical protein